MGLLSRKKSTPSLPKSPPSSSSSSSCAPPLPTSKTFSPSSSRPSLASLAAQELDAYSRPPELSVYSRFASRSNSSYELAGGGSSDRPNTPGAMADFNPRGIPDPRMGGGSLRGAGGGVGRDQEAALLAARKRRMASEGGEREGSVRSGRSEHAAAAAPDEVKVIQTRRRRATESKGSSPSPGPAGGREGETSRSTLTSLGSSTSSSYVLPPPSIPRPPTPPPPPPEKISFSPKRPTFDRSVSSPVNPRDSTITFTSSSLPFSTSRPASPIPLLPQSSFTKSTIPEAAPDAWKQAHEIVRSRGNSANSISSNASPPFSPPLSTRSATSPPRSMDPLLAPAGPVKRKKYDPLAAFGVTSSASLSPGATTSPVTGLALKELGVGELESAKQLMQGKGDLRGRDTEQRQRSSPKQVVPSALSEASHRTDPPPAALTSRDRSSPQLPPSILQKKSSSHLDTKSAQASMLFNILPPSPFLGSCEPMSVITPPTPPSDVTNSSRYPSEAPSSDESSFGARTTRTTSGAIPSPSSVARFSALQQQQTTISSSSPVAPRHHPYINGRQAPVEIPSQDIASTRSPRMASPPAATPLSFGASKSSGGANVREEKVTQKVLRRMGSFGFGRGEAGDASLIPGFDRPPGSPTTPGPKAQPVTPFYRRGSDASEGDETPPLPSSPRSYFPSFSPATTPPPGHSASLPDYKEEEKIDPFEKGEQTILKSPSKSSKGRTRTILHSGGGAQPKGPNKPNLVSVDIASSSSRRAPSPNGLPRSPRPSPKPSPSSSPRLLPAEIPSSPVSPRLSSASTIRPMPPQAPLPASAALPKTPLELQQESLPLKVVLPLPQPTSSAPPSTAGPVAPIPALPEPTRQQLPLLKTNLVGVGSMEARRAFFEQAGSGKKEKKAPVEVVKRETPRRDSALLPNSPPLTPQATPKATQASSFVESPSNEELSSNQTLPRAVPGESPPPPPAPALVSNGHHLQMTPTELRLKQFSNDIHSSLVSSIDGSDEVSRHWSASSANSSSTTVSSHLSSLISTPIPIARAAPIAPRATPPSSFVPSALHSPPTSPYIPPSADYSLHLSTILASTPPAAQDESRTAFPLIYFIGNRTLFAALLRSMSFGSWLSLYSTTRAVRRLISLDRDLREVVMERYLGSVGYKKWDVQTWGPETLTLTPNDLNAYLRCCSIPIHEFSQRSSAFLSEDDCDPSTVPLLQALTRHYSRVTSRVKLQAAAQVLSVHKARKRSSALASGAASVRGSTASIRSLTVNKTGVNFSSGLYRLNHAMLLRVFVPSPEGPWLSDQSVIACENELKTAGIFPVLKAGDCVWNAAVMEEGNAGYLIFDGYYLVDLDFQFSQIGEVPSCFSAFQFPPSYWHKVIKAAGNPLLYLDLSGPMGAELKKNTKLILDKAPMTSANGGREHIVQKWIHRSDLVLRETKGLVHADWQGLLVVLTQGTNEAVADLGRRLDNPGRTPYRLMRERSRPGEIWIRPVLAEESLLARV